MNRGAPMKAKKKLAAGKKAKLLKSSSPSDAALAASVPTALEPTAVEKTVPRQDASADKSDSPGSTSASAPDVSPAGTAASPIQDVAPQSANTSVPSSPTVATQSASAGSPSDWVQSLQAQLQHINPVVVQQVLAGVAGLLVLRQVTSGDSSSGPVNLPPVVGADTSVSVVENTTAALGTFAATDPEGKPISYSLDATSAQVFTINANGELRFIAAPDYDAGPHSYTVVITASDGQRTATRTITVNVTNVNDNPVVLVDGAASTGNTIAENASLGTVVAGLTLQASDADTTTAPVLTLVDDAGGLFVLDGTQVKLAQDGVLVNGSQYTIRVKATSSDGDTTETAFTIQATAGPSGGGAGFDGYLANALVWRDNDADGQWDANEPYAFTDAQGQFSGLAYGRGAITMTGLTASLRNALTGEPSADTTDISTGKVFTGLLSAPAGSTVVSPLTTLVVATGGDSTKLAALKAALGIPDNLDLTSFDPFAAMANPNADSALLTVALKAQTAALKVSNLLALASSTLGASGAGLDLASVVSGVATSLVNAAVSTGGGAGNLLDRSDVLLGALSTVAQSAGVTVSAETLNAAASAMASVNNSMSSSLAAAISSGNVTLEGALSALTSAVATQLVVLNNLVSAVVSAVSSGTVLSATTLTAQFSEQALAQQIEQAKSEVKTIVVVEEGQSVLVAVDDFATATFDSAWSVPPGNVASNDLSGGAAKTVISAMAGATGNLSNLAGAGADKSISLQGQYGVLTLHSDGSFGYVVNADNVLQATQDKAGLLLKDVFVYTVQAGTKTDAGQITVNIPNRAPVLGADTEVEFEEGRTSAVGTFAATDLDRNTITYSLDAESAKIFTIDAHGVLSFKQVPDYETLTNTSHVVTLTASDGLNSDTQKITVKVTDVNDPVQGALQFSSANNLFKVGNAITVSTAGLSDQDGLGTFNYSWQKQSGDSWTTISGSNAASYTPTQAGSYRLVLSYTDAHGHAEVVTGAPLTVASADSTNVAPALTGTAYAWPTAALPQDQVIELTLAQLLQGYTDSNGDPLNVSGLSATHAQVIEVRNDAQTLTGYRIVPTAGYHGSVVIAYSVEDGQGGSVPVSKTIGYNAAPTLAQALVDQTLTAGQSLNYVFANTSFADADDSALSYKAQWVNGNNILELPSWLQFDAASRTFSAQTSAANGLGAITVRVSADDGVNPAVSDDFTITVNPASTSKGMLSAPRAQLTVYQDNSNDGVVNYADAVTTTLTANYNSSSHVLGFANTATALPAGSLLALTDGKEATMSLSPSLTLPLANVPVLGSAQTGSLRVSLTRGTDAVRSAGEESQVSVDLQVQYLNDNSGALLIRTQTQTAQIHVINSSGSVDLTVPLSFGPTDVLASTSVQDGQSYLSLNILSLLTKLDGTIYGSLIGNVLKDGNYTLSFADLTGNIPFTNEVGGAIAAIEVGLPISSVAATNQPPLMVFGSDLDSAQLHVATNPLGAFPLGNFLLGGGGANSTGGTRFSVSDPDNNLAWVWVFRPQSGSLKLFANNTLSDVEYSALGQEQFARVAVADLAKLVYVPSQGDYNDTQTVNLRFMLEDSQHVLSSINTFKLDLSPNLYTNLGFELGGVINPDGGLDTNAQVLSLPSVGQVLYKAPNSNVFVAAELNAVIPQGSLLKYVAPATLDGNAAGQLRLGLFDNTSDLFSFEVINFYKATSPNHAPVLGEDVTVNFAENSTLAVGTFAATDADANNTVRYTLDTESAKVFTIDASGVLRFKQAPDYEALSNKSFTVVITASDGQASDTQTVTVNVIDANDPVQGTLQFSSVGSLFKAGNTITVSTAGLSDQDGLGTFSYRWQKQSGDSWIAIGDANEASYTPTQAGSYRLVLSYTDAQGHSETVTGESLTVASADSNVAPVLGADTSVNFEENSTTAVGTFAATDADGNAITYSLDEESAKIFAIDASGVLRFRQAPNYEALGNKSFTVVITASDGQASDTQTVTINVTNANDPVQGALQFTSINDQFKAGNAITVNTSDLRDEDGLGSFSYAWQKQIDQIWTAVEGANAASYTPTQAGSYRLVLSYTDAHGHSETVTGQALVVDSNAAPVMGADTAVDFEENSTAAVGTFAATDADGNPITYSLDEDSAKVFTIDASGVLRFKQAPNYEALNNKAYDVTITASDGLNSSAQKIVVNVIDANDPVQGALQFTSANNLFKAGNAITVSTSGLSDEDGLGSFSYNWQKQSGDSWATINGANSVNYTPSQAGTYRLVLSYTDAHGYAEEVTGAPLTVASADSTNVAPALTGTAYAWPTVALPQDQVIELTLAQLLQGYTDANADQLSVSGMNATHAQVLEVRDSQQVLTGYRIVPTSGYHGNVVVSYSVVDGQGGNVAVSKTLGYNAAPALTAPLVDQSVSAGQSLSYAIASSTFTDADDRALTYTAQWLNGGSLLELPAWLQFNAASGTFTAQTSAANGLGSITVRVTASDGINPGVSDDFTITVNPVSAGKGMLSSLGATLTVYEDKSNDNIVNYVDSTQATLTGSYSNVSRVLSFANTNLPLLTGSLLALTDGNGTTSSGIPSLSLPIANVPQIPDEQSGKLRVAFTAGTDATKSNAEAQVSVDIDVQYINVDGALVIRAVEQSAQVHVVNGSGSIDLTVPLSFSTSDVLASTSVQGGQAQLNLNILSLLTKLDGTLYGSVIGSVLRDGNYTLSFAAIGTPDAVLPLTDGVGQPVAGIAVGLPISSAATFNHPPSLVFGSDLQGNSLHVAISPSQKFGLGSFLLNGGGEDSQGGKRFDLADQENDLSYIWIFKPAVGSLMLREADALNAVVYTALGQEELVRISLADLSRLIYVPVQAEVTAQLRYMLEDSNHSFSTLQTIKLDLQQDLYTRVGFVPGSDVESEGNSLAANARVMELPTAGTVWYKVPGGEYQVVQIDAVIPQGALLKYVPPSTLDGDNAGSLRLALFDNDQDLFSFDTIDFYKATVPNRAPVLGQDVTVNFAENSTAAIGIYAATDPDGNRVSYTLDDASARIFRIDNTGQLRFIQSPDYEALTNKTFTVVITASDGWLSDTQTVTVNVTNVNEGITDITLSNPAHLQENISTAVEIGTLHAVADEAASANAIQLQLRGPDAGAFDIVNGKLVFREGQKVDYETRSSYSVTVRATDSSITPTSVIDRTFTVLVDNAPDTLTLAQDEITVHDYDGNGDPIDIQVQGRVNVQSSKNVLNFNMLSPLNRDNLLQLFDSDWETGYAPSLSFALADTSQVLDGSYTLHAGLDISNSRLGTVKVGMNFDVNVALTRINDQLQMLLPAQKVQLHLTAGGVEVLSLPLNNLDSDTLRLVMGDNTTPELEFKIDNLLYKASDNLIDLKDLSGNAVLSLGAGAVMGLFSGKTLGDLVSLSKDVINLPPDLQNTRLSRLIDLLQDTITLPTSLQNLSFEKVLGYAGLVLQLPSSMTLGSLLTTMRDVVKLPLSLQGSLGELKPDLVSALDQQTVQSVEDLARAVLGSPDHPYTGDLNGKTIPQILDLIANTDLAHTQLSHLGSLAGDLFGGYSVGQIIGITTHVVEGLYGDKTLGDLVAASKNAITLTPELAHLSGTSLVGLVNLSGMAIVGQDLLNGHLSVTGLLDVVRDAVTVDGVISNSRLAQIMELLDATFDLTPILGINYPVSTIITQLKNGQIDLESFINLTSGVLLSADGELNVTLGVGELGLTSAQGQTVDTVHLHALLDNSSNTAGHFSLLPQVPVASNVLDLGQLINNTQYTDPQGDSLRGVLISQPQANLLKIDDVLIAAPTVFVTQTQLEGHRVNVVVPDGLQVELNIRAVDTYGAVANDQWLLLQQSMQPTLM